MSLATASPGVLATEESVTHVDDAPCKKRKAGSHSNGLNDTEASVNGTTQDASVRTGGHDSLASQLYTKNHYAKIWAVAYPALSMAEPPTLYPEYTHPGGNKYIYRELDFWTSGFFPGSLFLLLERERKYKHVLQRHVGTDETAPHVLQLEFACKWWTANLHQNSALGTTHDLGFMIFPWAQLAWTLNHDGLAYNTIIRASKTLAARYVPATGAIRSWDSCFTQRYSFCDKSKDFLFIIDNMMNLDMLFWTAAQLGDEAMYAKAVSHAKTSQQHHVRPDFSTTHLVVLDPATGTLKSRLTNQGYADDSAWARGQAWALTGFAQTYGWTGDASFLETAVRCANYFLEHLPAAGVPPWDFSAPADQPQPPDTSAGVIAAYGMLLIHEAQIQQGIESQYLQHATRIIKGVCRGYLNPPSKFVATECAVETVERLASNVVTDVSVCDAGAPETILSGATINNYEFAPRRWADHGLVYADYYFLLVGNKLLEMKALGKLEDAV